MIDLTKVLMYRRKVGVKLKSLSEKGFFHLFLALGMGQTLSFVQRILLGRWLPLEDFGRYALIIETVTFLSVLMTLAFPTAMVRFGLLANRLDYYLSGTLRIFITLSIFIVFGFFVVQQAIGVFKDAMVSNWISYLIFLAVALAFANYIISYLSAKKKSKNRAVIVLGQRVILFFFVIFGSIVWAWQGALLGYFLSMFLFSLTLLWLFRKSIFQSVHNFPYKKLIGFTAWDSISYMGMGAVVFAILNISERALTDLSSISHLSIALSFTIVAKITFSSITDILFPYYAEKQGWHEKARFIVNVLSFFLILAGGLLVVSYTLLPWLIVLLLGQKFAAAIPLFKILIIGEIINRFSLFFELIMEIGGRVVYKAFGTLFSLGILVICLQPFLKQWGILGAAYGFLLFTLARLVFDGVGVLVCLLRERSSPVRSTGDRVS